MNCVSRYLGYTPEYNRERWRQIKTRLDKLCTCSLLFQRLFLFNNLVIWSAAMVETAVFASDLATGRKSGLARVRKSGRPTALKSGRATKESTPAPLWGFRERRLRRLLRRLTTIVNKG